MLIKFYRLCSCPHIQATQAENIVCITRSKCVVNETVRLHHHSVTKMQNMQDLYLNNIFAALYSQTLVRNTFLFKYALFIPKFGKFHDIPHNTIHSIFRLYSAFSASWKSKGPINYLKVSVSLQKNCILCFTEEYKLYMFVAT